MSDQTESSADGPGYFTNQDWVQQNTITSRKWRQKSSLMISSAHMYVPASVATSEDSLIDACSKTSHSSKTETV